MDIPESIKLTKYMFEDKKKEVKVYIDLTDEVFKGEEILENMVTFERDERSFSMRIVDSKSNTYTLEIKQLNDKIEPDNCKYTVFSNKIKI